MKPLIYSVEDDLDIQNVIKIALENSQFEISLFNSGISLFSAMEKEKPDLLLVDIMLPDISGLDIIRKIKKIEKFKDILIMVISAKTSEIDKVVGIDLGADDYLVKPFGVLELVSRVKALLRRKNNEVKDKDTVINGLRLDYNNYTVIYEEKSAILNKKLFSLMEYFIKNSNKLLSREELLNNVWGYDFFGETRTLDVHIKELRRKLNEVGLNKTVIETVRGVGYKLTL
ncbi:MAG: response regulator transcription factor [Candidatus Izemoplasmatales bacterium]|nr:response regulator transcription factor [Candidatus Izemoplasmatales bacterium]